MSVRKILSLAVLLLIGSCAVQALGSVEQIIADEELPAFGHRHQLLHSLSEQELRANADALFSFLNIKELPEGIEVNDYLSLANDIYDKLFLNDLLQQQLLEHAISVIPDDTVLFVWRDYCTQKLAYTLIERAVSIETRMEGLDLLSRLIEGEVPGLRGTALIVGIQLLEHGLTANESGITVEYIGDQAFDCARDERAQVIDRVTALQIAAQCQHSEIAVYLAFLLDRSHPDIAPMLRVSAIAALGVIGSEEHLVLLDSYRQSPDVRFRKAAKRAMEHIFSSR